MSVDNNHWQVVAALAGLAGTGLFVLSKALSGLSGSGALARGVFQVCLLLGLLAWIFLAWLRHDVVAGTGLLAATLLVLRHAMATHSTGRGDHGMKMTGSLASCRQTERKL